MKVACFSVACVDYYPQQKKYYPGGNSLNQALQFIDLGYFSAFVGAVGIDNKGTKLIELMTNKSIDITHTYQIEGQTASNQIIVDETGERYGIEGAWIDGVYGTFSFTKKDWDFIRDFEIWATHANSPEYQNALKNKTDNNFISVDFLDLTDYELLEKSSNVIDIAFFGGTHEMIDKLEKLAPKLKCLVVLTLGAEGSYAFSGSKVYRQNALPIDKVIDTTGCGDAFQSAFTSSYIKTKSIQEALYKGAMQGKMNALHFGGAQWNHQPNA